MRLKQEENRILIDFTAVLGGTNFESNDVDGDVVVVAWQGAKKAISCKYV